MTALQDEPSQSYPFHAQPLWRRALLSRETAIVALLGLVLVWGINFVSFFATQLTMTFLLLDIAPILLIALPMTMIIVTGEIDLSVASVVGLSSVIVGSLVDHGTSVPIAALV